MTECRSFHLTVLSGECPNRASELPDTLARPTHHLVVMEHQHASTTSGYPAGARSAPAGSSPAPPRPAERPPERDDPVRALRHARAIIDTLFGPAPQRPMHVRYWDGSIEEGRANP